MRRVKKSIVVLTAAAITLIMGVAQGQDSLKLNLKQSLGIALKENNQIVKAQYDSEEGIYKTREITAQALPQINASAGYTNNLIVPSLVINDQVIRAGLQYNTTLSAEATQQVFNQSVFTGIKAARVSEEYYNQNLERTEENVIQQTALLFYQTVAIQAQRNVLASNIQEVEKNLRIAEDRFKNGLLRKIDVDRLRVNKTNLNTQLLSLDNSYARSLNQFKLTVGIDLATPVVLDVPVISTTEMYNVDPYLINSEWQWEKKIEFQQFNTQLKLYDLERQSYASGYFPTLSAFARYSRTGVSSELMIPSDNSNWYNTSAVGLTLSVPVFDGFRKSSQIQQSKIHRVKTERDMSYTKQASQTNHTDALNALRTNYSNYLAQMENVELAGEVFKVITQNYNEGISPLTEMLDAETSYLIAQNQLIGALLKVKEAEVDLLKAKGEVKNLLN